MRRIELYSEFTREEAISLLIPSRESAEFSNGELLIWEDVGVLFVVIGQPPDQSYFLTNQVLRWKSSESGREFYSSVMLPFRSENRELYLFGRVASEEHYKYLGSLRVVKADGTWPNSSRRRPNHVIVQFEVEPELPVEVWNKFDWSTSPIVINGLPLPNSLTAVIASGRWKAPTNDILQKVFEDNSRHPWFPTPDQMERLTYELRFALEDGFGDAYALTSPESPGHVNSSDDVLDVSRAIYIGDTGPDEPFCLDYRTSQLKPRVVYPDSSSAWQVVAPDFETLAKLLDL